MLNNMNRLDGMIHKLEKKKYPAEVSSNFCMDFWETVWQVKDLTERMLYIDRFQDALTGLRDIPQNNLNIN